MLDEAASRIARTGRWTWWVLYLLKALDMTLTFRDSKQYEAGLRKLANDIETRLTEGNW